MSFGDTEKLGIVGWPAIAEAQTSEQRPMGCSLFMRNQVQGELLTTDPA